MLSPARRLLCITAHGCDCFLVHGGGLVLEAHFEPDPAEDFAAFVQSRKRSVFTAVADQLEEDFRQDTMPYLRGPARTRLLERKAGQT